MLVRSFVLRFLANRKYVFPFTALCGCVVWSTQIDAAQCECVLQDSFRCCHTSLMFKLFNRIVQHTKRRLKALCYGHNNLIDVRNMQHAMGRDTVVLRYANLSANGTQSLNSVLESNGKYKVGCIALFPNTRIHGKNIILLVLVANALNAITQGIPITSCCMHLHLKACNNLRIYTDLCKCVAIVLYAVWPCVSYA